jgi:hypothetical protein
MPSHGAMKEVAMAHGIKPLAANEAPAHSEAHEEPVLMHIEKKYGKFKGHVQMASGAKHEIAPQASMAEAHQAMSEHVAPHMEESAENEPGESDVEEV